MICSLVIIQREVIIPPAWVVSIQGTMVVVATRSVVLTQGTAEVDSILVIPTLGITASNSNNLLFKDLIPTILLTDSNIILFKELALSITSMELGRATVAICLARARNRRRLELENAGW